MWEAESIRSIMFGSRFIIRNTRTQSVLSTTTEHGTVNAIHFDNRDDAAIIADHLNELTEGNAIHY